MRTVFYDEKGHPIDVTTLVAAFRQRAIADVVAELRGVTPVAAWTTAYAAAHIESKFGAGESVVGSGGDSRGTVATATANPAPTPSGEVCVWEPTGNCTYRKGCDKGTHVDLTGTPRFCECGKPVRIKA